MVWSPGPMCQSALEQDTPAPKQMWKQFLFLLMKIKKCSFVTRTMPPLFSRCYTKMWVFCRECINWSKTDPTISGQYKVTCLTASSLGRRYVFCVFLSSLCCRVCEWRHLLQQRHRGLAEGLNHSHGNVRSWERADKHKHSPYHNTQTWKTTP